MDHLNETEEGGETKFNLLKNESNEDLMFKLELGMDVIWNNLNQTEHQMIFITRFSLL